jgi:hypothetical protein
MPYEIVPDHPDCADSPDGGTVAVVKVGDGEVMGCHADIASAEDQVAALNAAEEMDPEEDAITAAASLVTLADLTGVPDEELHAEIARRLVEDVVAAVPDADPAMLEGEASDAVEEALGEVAEEIAEEAAGDMLEGEGEGEDPMPEDMMMAADDEVTAAPDEDPEAAPMASTSTWDWEGVLTVEGLPSGDGRMIKLGCLTYRDLPVPLMLQTVTAQGHSGAVICGSIHEIERVEHDGFADIVGRGMFDSGENGTEARRLLSEGTMRGVSVDIDKAMAELVDPDTGEAVSMEDAMFGAPVVEMLVEGRIMGATLTPFPAFQEAYITVSDAGTDDALVAAGAVGDVWTAGVRITDDSFTVGGRIAPAALVASGGVVIPFPAAPPVSPPVDWFSLREMTEPEPFTVHADGRCYGLIARWGSCHIGFRDRCVNVPRGDGRYSKFRNKRVLCEQGEFVWTGPIFADTVHPDLRAKASDAMAHYAHTGTAIADVTLYDNEWGIVAAGAVRPDATPQQIRGLRGSDVSPDWRPIDGRHELVGLLAVNVSGFIVDGLVASAGVVEAPKARALFDSVTGEFGAIVAAGVVHRREPVGAGVLARLEALEQQFADDHRFVRRLRAQAAAERISAFNNHAPTPCGCKGVVGG